MCKCPDAVDKSKEKDDTKPQIKACKPDETHCVLAIEQITFEDNHKIDKDTLGDFGSPEWINARVEKDQSPVCYTRNKKVKLTAVFKVNTKPSKDELVKITGVSVFDKQNLEWNCEITVHPTDTEITTTAMTSSKTLPDYVGYYNKAMILWGFKPANCKLSDAGTSEHLFYVTLADPDGVKAYWTILDISCRAAHGKTTEAAVVTDSFVPFKSRSLTRKRDGHVLTYWNPDSTTATDTQQLLARSDGSGQCGSWSEFLIDMYKCHGITSADKILVVRTRADHSSSTVGFLVKNWTFVGSGTGAAPWTHKMGTECTNQPGVAGQENPNPPPAFFNHFIVKQGSNLFDPSYGVGPVSSKLGWENGAIDGLFNDAHWTGFPKGSHSSSNLLEFWNLRTGAAI